jgi:Bacterial Ig-like domain (group 2)
MRAAPSILTAAIATLLLGCSDSTGPSDGPSVRARPSPEAVYFQVSPLNATLLHGETRQFTTTYPGNPAFTSAASAVSWHSSDESVATVSSGGLVRGLSGGQARIVATRGRYQASALVTVTGPMKKHEGPQVCLSHIPSAEQDLILC